MPILTAYERHHGRILLATSLVLLVTGCGPDNEEEALKGSLKSSPSSAKDAAYNQARSSEEAFRVSGPEGARGTPTENNP